MFKCEWENCNLPKMEGEDYCEFHWEELFAIPIIPEQVTDNSKKPGPAPNPFICVKD